MVGPTKTYDFVKAFLDFLFAGILLVVLSPVLALLALFVLVTMGRPIIFAQQRLGQHGKPFTIYKFRTMREGVEVAGVADDASRQVPAGKLLRKLSLDELPQLWNVLRGDMSIIGPRPLLVEYLPLYTPAQARRMEVKPGITGLAQVEGRNSLSWPEKFALDVKYVEKRGFPLDFLVVVKSLLVVAQRNGVNPRNQSAVSPFTGQASEPGTG